MYRQGLKLVGIAKELGVPEGTVRRWKHDHDWDGHWTEHKGERSGRVKANVRKRGGQPGNHNASGGPPKNKKAEKHGFWSRWLPEETREIFETLAEADPLILLWQNIQLQYAAIIRAQRIAYVKDIMDKTKELVSESFSDGGEAAGYEIQQAWDKQAEFLKAQSRAMDTLRNMIKQYMEGLQARGEDLSEEQKLKIELLRAQVKGLQAGSGDQGDGYEALMRAISGAASRVWTGEEDGSL